MGKPKGTYITIEAGNMDEEDEDYHREISVQLAKIIRQLIQEKNEELSVLVVGLGNREVTPDALGPRVVDNLFITRHIVKEYGKYAFGEKNVNRISSIVPGVMAQTGMESLEIIHGIIDETKPDLVIVIDALAARSTKRLNRTIQVTDTGINPLEAKKINAQIPLTPPVTISLERIKALNPNPYNRVPNRIIR